jgi:hypothetical protein
MNDESILFESDDYADFATANFGARLTRRCLQRHA